LLSKNKRKKDFVRYPNGEFQGRVERITLNPDPEVSVIIPTLDGYRNGYLTVLLEQIKKQSFSDIEVLVIHGDHRQGRAINLGALIARGRILITMDDDTRLGHKKVIENMVRAIKNNPDIGIVGVSNVVPKEASLLIRLAMKQIPRRSSPIVSQITDSDMAEHPCLAIPKSLFCRIGGENELIPRGLDPYLRYMVRNNGYRVVVIPKTWIHHLPPPSLLRLIRQFFRNGKGAAFCQKFYPQWVLELTRSHSNPQEIRRGIIYRLARNYINLLVSLIKGKPLYFVTQVSYLAGFCLSILTLKQDC
jgi:glycosyltransferase involved in cell wall biosynthesis